MLSRHAPAARAPTALHLCFCSCPAWQAVPEAAPTIRAAVASVVGDVPFLSQEPSALCQWLPLIRHLFWGGGTLDVARAVETEARPVQTLRAARSPLPGSCLPRRRRRPPGRPRACSAS
jgi:hypothetical protein